MPEPKKAYRVRRGTRIIRSILRNVFRLIFKILYRVQIDGFEKIPAAGAYLVAHNHISIVEPPFIITFWPQVLESISAVEVFSRRGQATLVRLYGAIPVHREQFDRQLIETVIRILESGHPLIIAPEGGRSHEPGLRRAWPGIGYIVEKCRVPVIPVGVIGSSSGLLKEALRLKRPVLIMRIGTPLLLPPPQGGAQAVRAARQANADLIMRQVADLLPESYRGVYADSHRDAPKANG